MLAMSHGRFVPADVSNPPFKLPADLTIMVDLPFPPSLNHIWLYNRKGVGPSPKYQAWKKAADSCALMQHIYRNQPRPIIAGKFEATILLDQRRRGDLDNLGKAILDWAQSRTLIANDKHCRKLTLEFVEPHRAPHGARLILTGVASPA